jgi:putative ABC transport system ATP-binding protein
VSCEIAPGEFVGITGPSGSGKSTLLHLIGGLDTPTSGTIAVNDVDVGALSDRKQTRFRLETVGVVFQHFYLVDALSARANVALPLVEQGVGKRARRERATELLESVGLGDRLTHKPRELSGGEQQRVAIARALSTDPPLLIADEPTGELDSATAERVLDAIESVADNRTVVVASHDRQALARAGRQLEITDGAFTAAGTDGDGPNET